MKPKDAPLVADARRSLELAKVLWADENRKAAKPQMPNTPPPEEFPDPPSTPLGGTEPEPGAMEHVVALLQENSDSGLTEAIDGLIHSTISYHAPLSHGSEVAWALWAAIWFERSIPTPVANKLVSNRDSAVGILALHARELGLIKKSVALHDWASSVSQRVFTARNGYSPTRQMSKDGFRLPLRQGSSKMIRTFPN